MNGEGPRQGWEITRDEWRALSLYGRFEQLITWVLAATIALIVCVASFRLVSDVVRLLLVQALNPLEHEVFPLAVALLALGVTYWLLRNGEGLRLGLRPSPPDAAKPVR